MCGKLFLTKKYHVRRNLRKNQVESSEAKAVNPLSTMPQKHDRLVFTRLLDKFGIRNEKYTPASSSCL